MNRALKGANDIEQAQAAEHNGVRWGVSGEQLAALSAKSGDNVMALAFMRAAFPFD